MVINATETVRAFFSDNAPMPANADVRIDVLDSWTNDGLAAVRPTTISWSESRDDTGR